ncbi:MAG: ATP-binding protein [Pseudomonadota bacterium]
MSTQGEFPADAAAPSYSERMPRRARLWALGLTSLAVKIIVVMLVGLALLLGATLYLTQFRSGLVDAQLGSLLVQGDTIARAFAAGAEDEEPLISVALGTNVEATASEAGQEGTAPVITSVDTLRAEHIITEALHGTDTRVRLYGVHKEMLVDSQTALRSATDVTTAPLPPLVVRERTPLQRTWDRLMAFGPVAGHDTLGESEPTDFSEVVDAFGGVKSARPRVTENQELIVSVAVPIASGETILGVLHLTSLPGIINAAARAEELAIMKVFAIAACIAVLLSILLAATISRPISRLARAAERISQGGAYQPIPELRRSDEIGDLSRTLHDMTAALYSRIDAIEAFAGEVAHELKNPLTSINSAVETLPLAKTDKSKMRLMEVLQHDVRRIDRLISDISEASKLDAELNRHRQHRFDLYQLVSGVVDGQNELAEKRHQTVRLTVRGRPGPKGFIVQGNDGRLGQVFANLIDNARSFTPEGGQVTVSIGRAPPFVEVVVDDEGPGIEEEVMERIFERFYTDRTEQQSFGNNSGLGLAISRQIVEAHNGEIFAENRYRTTLSPTRDVAGARFTVRLREPK